MKRMSTRFKPSQRVAEQVGGMLVEEGEGKIKVLASLSQSSMDDILIRTGPSIEEHASVISAYGLPLPPHYPPKSLTQIPPLPVAVLSQSVILSPSIAALSQFSLCKRRLSCMATLTCGMFEIPTHCGYSFPRGRNSQLSRTPSASLRGHPRRLGYISYPMYSHAWTTSIL